MAYVRTQPTMAFLVLAKNAEAGHSFGVPDVVEYVLSSLGSTPSSIVREDKFSVGGREGVLLGIDGAGPNEEFNYAVWLSATGTQAIIAMVSATSVDATPAEVGAEATRVFDTMEFR